MIRLLIKIIICEILARMIVWYHMWYLDLTKFSYKKGLLYKLALACKDENKIKINEKSHKNIVIYQIEYVPVKFLSFKKNNSVNLL